MSDINKIIEDDVIEGGRLVAQGQYGCTFIPTLKCKDSKKKEKIPPGSYINKFTLEDDADDELELANVIKSIPLWKNYFIVPEFSCIPAPIDKQTEKNFDKCNVIDKQKYEDFRILRMRFGGVSLRNFKHSISDYPIMSIFKHLLEAGSLLTLFGIVHFDLHDGNILVDKFNVPRIIDFGLSKNIRSKNLADSPFRFQHYVNNLQIPPDFTLVNGIARGLNGMDIIDEIIKDKMILKKIQSIVGVSIDNMYSDLKDFYLKSTSTRDGDTIKWFRTYWRTFDSWSIGSCIIYIISNLTIYTQFQPLWKKEGKIMIPILKKMCEVTPLKRIDCVQALAKLDPNNFILRKYATSWLSKVGSGF